MCTIYACKRIVSKRPFETSVKMLGLLIILSISQPRSTNLIKRPTTASTKTLAAQMATNQPSSFRRATSMIPVVANLAAEHPVGPSGVGENDWHHY